MDVKETQQTLDDLLIEIRGCTLCGPFLPLGPRPVLRARISARILIISQAPGTRVHETGIPWNDRSGDRLRDWLQMDRDTFYDESRVAIVPMGFCYPGVDGKGGDNPPRPECAPLWHARVMPHLRNVRLTLLIGTYAQKRYLGKGRKPTMTATVAAFAEHLPAIIPLPHPSWRTTGWQKRNLWFDLDLLPVLRNAVRAALD